MAILFRTLASCCGKFCLGYAASILSAGGSVDPAEITESQYQVVFEDQPTSTVWHLVNTTSSDTVLTDQHQQGGEADLFEVAEGIRVVVTNGERQPGLYQQTSFGSGDTTLIVSTFTGPVIPYLTGNPAYIWSDAPFWSLPPGPGYNRSCNNAGGAKTP